MLRGELKKRELGGKEVIGVEEFGVKEEKYGRGVRVGAT